MDPTSPLTLAPPGLTAADPAAPALARVARIAAAAFTVPFAAVVPFGPGGDGVAAVPVSAGRLGGGVPDPRLACASLPADAALVVVEDAARDARIRLPPGARFFACARAEAPDGRVVGAVCLFDDTPRALSPTETERLADLAALAALVLGAAALADACEQAEARFQALSEATFDALLILEDGVVLDANERAADLFGYDGPEALIGRSVYDLVPDDLAEEVEVRLGIAGRHEAAVLRADGTQVAVEVSANAFPHQGRLLRITAVRAGD